MLKSGTSPLLAKRVAAVWHLPPDLLFFASASALLQGSYARNRPQASTASLSTLRNVQASLKNPRSELLGIAKEPKKPSRFPTKLDIPQSMLNSWQREWWCQVISSLISVCTKWYDTTSSPLDPFRELCPMILSSCSVHCGILASRASEMRWLKSKTKEESKAFSASSGSFNLHSSAWGKMLPKMLGRLIYQIYLLSLITTYGRFHQPKTTKVWASRICVSSLAFLGKKAKRYSMEKRERMRFLSLKAALFACNLEGLITIDYNITGQTKDKDMKNCSKNRLHCDMKQTKHAPWSKSAC